MASEIKVDTIVNAGGDNDTGIDLSTNDVVKFDIAGAEKARVHSDGKVGIGETTPLANLHIKSADSGVTPSADSDELFIEGSGNSGITIGSGSSNSGTIRFADSGTDNRGNITFNHSNEAMTFTTAASERMKIDSSGDLRVQRIYDNTTSGGANVRVQSDGLLQRDTSSQRYKNTINDATHGLTELLNLRSVTFKGNNDGDTIFGGLIAEEVHDAGLTEFVEYDDQNRPDALRYSNMVSLCIKAIQELKTELDNAKARITALEGN